MRKLLILAVLALCAGVALAAAPPKGSVHASSDTEVINRDFWDPVANLTVAPATGDVIVLHKPHLANQDSFTVRAGDVMNWTDLRITGFRVLRASATAVDVYWW